MATVCRHVTDRLSGFTDADGGSEFRAAGMLETPNAAIIFTSGNKTTSASIDSTAKIHIGLAAYQTGVLISGGRGYASQDAAANVNNVTTGNNAIQVLSDDLTTTVAEGQVTAFLPYDGFGAGIRVTWTTAPTSVAIGCHISIVLISCMNAYCDTLNLPTSVNLTTTATTNFRPKAVLALLTPLGEPEPSLCFGVGLNSDLAGGIQHCQTIAEDFGAATSASIIRLDEERIVAQIDSTGAITQSADITAYSDTGFTVTLRDGFVESNSLLYLALDTGLSRVALETIVSRTSVGDQTIDVGFRPQMVINPVSMAEDWTAYTDSRAGSFGFNIFGDPLTNTTLPSRHYGITLQDNTGTTNTYSCISYLVADQTINAFDHGGEVGTRIGYIPLHRIGWRWHYYAAPSAAKLWWAFAIEEPVLGVNPPVRRMYSLLHGLALSIVTRVSPLSAVASPLLRDDLIYRTTSYKHEIAADGGYLSAQITMNTNRDEVYQWVESGVAKEITVYDHGQQVIFQGIVNNVSAKIGLVDLDSGSLVDVINQLRVAYRTVRYDAINYGGQERITDVQGDTTSQDFFGVLAEVFNGGESSDSEAEQLQASLLAELAHLQPSTTINSGGGGNAGASVTIDCLGYSAILDKYFYESSTTGLVDADQKIRDVLAADPNLIFNDTYVEANNFQVGAQSDERGKAATVIKGIVSIGDSQNNRYIDGGTAGRRYYYRPIPTTSEYILYLSDTSFHLRNINGNIVHPWNALPGRWTVVPDISLSRSIPTNLAQLDADPRSVFVERVGYSSPYGLQLVGGRVNTINQELAKRGLGGMS